MTPPTMSITPEQWHGHTTGAEGLDWCLLCGGEWGGEHNLIPQGEDDRSGTPCPVQVWEADRKGLLFLCVIRVQHLWEQGYNEVDDLRPFMPDVGEDIVREALYDVAKRLSEREKP